MADHQKHHEDQDTDGLIAGHFAVFLIDLGGLMMSAFRLAFRR